MPYTIRSATHDSATYTISWQISSVMYWCPEPFFHSSTDRLHLITLSLFLLCIYIIYPIMFCNYPYDLVYYKCTTYCTWGSSSCCEIIIAKWLNSANSQLVCVVATFWRQEWNGSLSAHWRIHGRARGMAVICGKMEHSHLPTALTVPSRNCCFSVSNWAKDLQTATQLGYSCKTRAFFSNWHM